MPHANLRGVLDRSKPSGGRRAGTPGTRTYAAGPPSSGVPSVKVLELITFPKGKTFRLHDKIEFPCTMVHPGAITQPTSGAITRPPPRFCVGLFVFAVYLFGRLDPYTNRQIRNRRIRTGLLLEIGPSTSTAILLSVQNWPSIRSEVEVLAFYLN